MNQTIAGALAFSVLVATVHCSSPGSEPTTEALPLQAANGIPCAVNEVLGARCLACHGDDPAAGASTSFTSWGALQKKKGGKKVADLIEARLHDDDRPMPPSPRLTEEQLNVLDDWLKGGARESDEACGGSAEDATARSGGSIDCEDGERTVFKASRPFVMEEDAPLDQYVCFGVDVERDEKRHLVGFGPSVDNAKILHHILLFQSPEAVDSKPAPCKPTAAATWTMIGGWAPGGRAKELPPEAGFPEPKGTTHYVMQMHYNNALNLRGAKDNSGFEVCSTKKLRKHDAGVVAFGAMNIGKQKNIAIPARVQKHSVTCSYTWNNDSVTFFTASPHMHKRGRSLRSVTASGRLLADQPRFDFEQQVGAKVSSKIARATW